MQATLLQNPTTFPPTLTVLAQHPIPAQGACALEPIHEVDTGAPVLAGVRQAVVNVCGKRGAMLLTSSHNGNFKYSYVRTASRI